MYFVLLQVIDGILSTVDSFVSNKSASKPKIEVLVNSVLDFLSKCRSTPKSLLTKGTGVESMNPMINSNMTRMNVCFCFYVCLLFIFHFKACCRSELF